MTVLGIEDPWIWGAYILCVLATLQCVVYGILNWNKGKGDEAKEIAEELSWEKKESALEKELGVE